MKAKSILGSTLIVALAAIAAPATAATYMFSEAPGSVRFEQYAASDLVLWRLPTPGVSTFPGGSCTHLVFPAATVDKSPRFIAIYMQAQSLGTTFFVQYDTSSCQVVSFGTEQ